MHFLEANKAHWLVNEVRQYWKRGSAHDVTSRTHGDAGRAGVLLRSARWQNSCSRLPVYHADRPETGDNRAPPTIEHSAMNFGPYR